MLEPASRRLVEVKESFCAVSPVCTFADQENSGPDMFDVRTGALIVGYLGALGCSSSRLLQINNIPGGVTLLRLLFDRIVLLLNGVALFLVGLAFVDFLLRPLAPDYNFDSTIFRMVSILVLTPLTLLVGS